MKKLFFLVATCLVALSANAAVVTLNPGDDINAAITAAGDGDVIELTTGNYEQSSSIKVGKALTIQAAAGAKPNLKIYRIEPNAEFVFKGLNVTTEGEYMLHTTAGGNFSVRIEDCTFDHSASAGRVYYLSNGQTIKNLTVNNCVFEGSSADGTIYAYGTVSGKMSVTNCTFANNSGAGAVYLKNVPDAEIDHCTFYNNGVRPIKSENDKNNVIVSNCVVSNPSAEGAEYCISIYKGTVGNCVYYNTKAPRSSSSVDQIEVTEADPQFIDPANGNFNFRSTSPLVGKATDETNIGDPRWKVAEAQMTVSLRCLQIAETATDLYAIALSAIDPDGTGTITLEYSTDKTAWTEIAKNLPLSTLSYDWNIRTMAAGAYYLRATLANATKSVQAESAAALTIVPDTQAPRDITDFAVSTDHNSTVLTWTNPTHNINAATTIYTLAQGMTGAEMYTSSNATATIATAEDGLKVDYSTSKAWEDAGVKFTPANPAEVLTNIAFDLKGNGSGHNIRLTIEQDGFDWWYVYVPLSENKMQTISIDKFEKLTWHNNQKGDTFDGTNITAVYFVVSVGDASAQGSFVINNVEMTGVVPPVADYEKTIIVRNTTAYPATITDGTVVYEGTEETCTDTNLAEGTYYYSAFALDDLGNVSAAAQVTATITATAIEDAVLCKPVEKRIENGQVVIIRNNVRYNALGTTVK